MIIQDILGLTWSFDCIGCAIGAGDVTVPGGMIAETEQFVLHQDPEVPIPGFLIVAARRHVQSIAQLDAPAAQEFFQLVYRARQVMRLIPALQDVTLIQEERSEHLHLWLLPRYAWMDSQFKHSLDTIREMTKYARKHWGTEENIRQILATVKTLREEMAHKL